MIAVLTDSTCDLPPHILQRLGIHMMPLSIASGGQTWRDWETISPSTVFERLKQGEQFETGPVTLSDFHEAYARMLRQYTGIVSVHISSGISDTVPNALQAVRALAAADRVRVIDSGVSSVLLASAVLRAKQIAECGGDLDAVARAAQRTLEQQYGEFTVPNLEYLRRGGRISAVQFAVGNILAVRPVVSFDEQGKLTTLRRVRADSAVDDMLASLRRRFGRQPLSVAVGLAGNEPEHLAELRLRMKASGLNIREGRTQQIGAVIGAHTGPGMFAFVAEPYREISSSGVAYGRLK